MSPCSHDTQQLRGCKLDTDPRAAMTLLPQQPTTTQYASVVAYLSSQLLKWTGVIFPEGHLLTPRRLCNWDCGNAAGGDSGFWDLLQSELGHTRRAIVKEERGLMCDDHSRCCDGNNIYQVMRMGCNVRASVAGMNPEKSARCLHSGSNISARRETRNHTAPGRMVRPAHTSGFHVAVVVLWEKSAGPRTQKLLWQVTTKSDAGLTHPPSVPPAGALQYGCEPYKKPGKMPVRGLLQYYSS
ncbi:unnamed protein product [Pleuronectes platessa]|uniref:Uncharacterized protein n=1 Tax=Pleuronectes platessa TaxID=8262 RepID=A0A9N7Z4H3_PLEPL|nr:unnamed protein product [Pleuronectes platessa]